MQRSATIFFPSLAPALAGLGLALAAGCGGHGHGHHGPSYSIPRYAEAEPNDSFAQADDFGLLYPDELFIIEGALYDPFYDPFDGFAFRSSAPLYVAFSLLVDDAWSEVRVGLYDVALGQTVAYWYQDHGEVYGELDVYDAGTDFHLFVEPLHGGTRYDLQIESFRLYGASAAAPRSKALGPAGSALAPRAAAELDEAERAAARRYAPSVARGASLEAREPQIVGSAIVLDIDPESGAISRDAFLITAGGSWMGIPGMALVE